MATRITTNKDGSRRKTRSAPKTDLRTSHRLAQLTDAEIISRIAAYIRETATEGRPIGLNQYEQTQPPELPSIGTIRITRGITWNQCVEAAGFTPRAQAGGKKRRRPAAPAQRQPEPAPAEYIARPQIVTGPGPAPAATVNVYSCADDAADDAAEQEAAPREGRPGRPLDPAALDLADLPEPERDPITGRLPAVLDCNGRPWPRVIVYPDEYTCKECGETFTAKRQRRRTGRRSGEKWIEELIGFCARCGMDEDGNNRRNPTPPAAVPTLDYLQAGEYQKA